MSSFKTQKHLRVKSCQLQKMFPRVLLREEVSVRAAVLQGHAVASGAHAVSRYGQRAVVIGQSGVLHHRHVPQKRVRRPLRLHKPASIST